MAYGMVGETLHKVSRNGSLPGGGHRVLDREAEVSWCRIWCSDRIPVGRDPDWKLLSRARFRSSQSDCVPSIPFRNRLLGGTQFLSEPERRRLALGGTRYICSRH